MEDIEPLSRQQQIFLQRFLARHILTDNEAQTLFQTILQEQQEQQRQRQQQRQHNEHGEQQRGRNQLGRDVKDTLKRINRSLRPAFRLEIKSVALALPLPKDPTANENDMNNENNNNDNDNDSDDEYRTTGRQRGKKLKKSKTIMYHAIVNCDSDDVSKTASNPTFTKSPHEFAFFRLLLEQLVEKDHTATTNVNANGEDGDADADSRRGKGCSSYMSRMDMINARLDLTGVHERKVSIAQAENTLNLLEVQGWFVAALPLDNNNGGNDDDDENNNENNNDNDNDGDGDAMMTPTRRSVRRRSTYSTTNDSGGGGGGDGGDGGSKYLQIGPRSYLEFPDFLIKAGLENEKLPQFLLHG